MSALDLIPSIGQKISPSTWIGVVVIGTIAAAIIRFQLLQSLVDLIREMLWIPWTVTRQMRKQGHVGPAFGVFKNNKKEMQELRMKAPSEPMLTSSGMSHDLIPRILPHIHAWRTLYGDNFLFKQGSKVTMHTADAEAIKEIFANQPSDFAKCPTTSVAFDVLGSNGLLFSNGDEWARQRRVTRPAFYLGRSKKMGEEMASWIEVWLQQLDKLVQDNGNSLDLDMYAEFNDLVKDILARSSFGSSFAKGKEGFEHQERLKDLAFQQGARVITNPLFRWMPTALRKEIDKEKGEVLRCLREIIEERSESIQPGNLNSYDDDLIGLLLADRDRRLHDQGGRSAPKLDKENERITDQCRTFFFAGQETVHNVLSWAVVLLGHYTNWQERIRAELQEAFRGKLPDADQVMKLNQLEMFVEETLRLYSPAPAFHREVINSHTSLLGEPLPKHLVILIDLGALHRDKQYWGDNALEFKPERFAHGVAKACKKPYAFQPFGGGPRICVALAFAMLEVKLVLAMLLQRFSFRISPTYRHEPMLGANLQPKFGVQVVLERVQPASQQQPADLAM